MKHVPCFIHTLGYIQPPAPIVTAVVVFPRFNTSKPVYFLIDTGAASTCLHSLDALPFQRRFVGCQTSTSDGVGGDCEYYLEKALLLFTDDHQDQLIYSLEIGVQKVNLNNVRSLPNLLGRDLLGTWALHYDHANGGVSLFAPDDTPILPPTGVHPV